MPFSKENFHVFPPVACKEEGGEGCSWNRSNSKILAQVEADLERYRSAMKLAQAATRPNFPVNSRFLPRGQQHQEESQEKPKE